MTDGGRVDPGECMQDAAIAHADGARRNAPNVLHVITSLSVGGAQCMLAKLLEHDGGAKRQSVISLMPVGLTGRQLQARGVRVDSLEMRKGALSIAALMRLRRLIKQRRSDIVVAWMHHAFFAVWLAGLGLNARPPVIWNVRHSLDDIGREKPMTRLILRVSAAASSSPAAIVYNSRVAARQYREFGFSDEKAFVIPNGFDTEKFKPDPQARRRLEEIFSLAPDATVVALVARYHEMKDPATLVEAVARLRDAGRDAHLLLVGQGMDDPPAGLSSVLSRLPADRVTLSGHRPDLADWLAGVDILALTSAWGEGFPNILGEAMACGVPCVATDVGDSAWIISEAGRAAPRGDAGAVAAALKELIDLGPEGRRALGLLGRARIVENFGLQKIREEYERLYDRTARATLGPAGAKAAPSSKAAA